MLALKPYKQRVEQELKNKFPFQNWYFITKSSYYAIL